MTWPEALVWVAAIVAVACVLIFGNFHFGITFKDDES